MGKLINRFTVPGFVFFFGIFSVCTSYMQNIIPESELRTISGNLASVTYYSKRPLAITLEGVSMKFGYVSYGHSCGVVYSKLVPYIGRHITLKYDPEERASRIGNEYHKVYDIRTDMEDVCPYSKIYAMKHASIIFGYVFGGFCVFAYFLIKVVSIYKSRTSRPA